MGHSYVHKCLIFLLFAAITSVSDTNRTKHPTFLDQLLHDYDKDIRPMLGIQPVKVSAEILIDSIGIIEEAKMEIPVYFFLRQYWEDKRLAGKLNRSITIAGGVIGKFWKPDIYCYNARQSNLMVEDKDVNSRLTINTSGAIHYSRGSTVVASCDMNLRNFPMDTQHCRLTFGSYSQSDSDIIFSWKTKTITVDQKEMSQFNLDGIELGRRAKIYYGVNYTQIFFTINLTRRSGYYIIQVYCPDILIVALSWIVLWMDADAIGDRLSLGITTILTVMFLLGSTNSSMPKVSYAKALDWYLLVSFAFVFMTLFESMLVFMMIAHDDGSKKNTEKASEIRRS